MNNGVIYPLIGEKYYFVGGDSYYWKHCKYSFESLKKHCPDLHTTLITNTEIKNDDPGFDDVLMLDTSSLGGITPHPWLFKVFTMMNTPYQKTIQLDVDTKIHSDRILEIYDVLDRVDMTAALSGVVLGFNRHVMDHVKMEQYKKTGESKIPPAFSDHNVGVLGFNKNEKTTDCFNYMREMMSSVAQEDERWLRKYRYDHPEFLFETLPPQFNYRGHATLGNDNYLLDTIVEHRHLIWET